MAITILINDNEGIYAYTQHASNELRTFSWLRIAREQHIITRSILIDENIATNMRQLTPEVRQRIIAENNLANLTEDDGLESRYFTVRT